MGPTEQAQWGPEISYVAERVMLLADPPPNPESSKPRCCWFRFSLRTLLILTVILSIAFGWLGSILIRVREQRRIVAQIEARGGWVQYEHKLEGDRVNEKAPLPGPRFVRMVVGDDAYAYVGLVGSWDRSFTDQDLARFSELPRLKQIVMLNAQEITDKGMEHLAQVRELRGLCLSEAKVTPAGFARLRSNEHLESLTLPGTWVNDDVLAVVGTFPNLTDLGISNAPVTSAGISHVANLKKLRTLSIREAPAVGDPAMNAISQLDGLESLYLHTTSITDVGFSQVQKLERLKELFVFGTPISDRGIAHLASAVNLAKVQLYGNGIGDVSLQTLAKLKSLETLHLYDTSITDEGMRQIAAMATLRDLNVSGDDITDAGALRLAALRDLEELRIGPVVTEDAAKELKRRLPNCEILIFDQKGSGYWITAD